MRLDMAMQGTSWGQHLIGIVWGLTSLGCSLIDWPLRNLSGGRLASKIRPVRSSTAVSIMCRVAACAGQSCSAQLLEQCT